MNVDFVSIYETKNREFIKIKEEITRYPFRMHKDIMLSFARNHCTTPQQDIRKLILITFDTTIVIISFKMSLRQCFIRYVHV